MGIQRVKCRAEISVGGITVRTPYVQSFNVRKQRGQVSTFDASLKIPAGTASSLAGGDVVIKAGEGSASNTIFTGVCRAAKVSPCFDDPSFVILSCSGADKLSYLQGKKFTRRCIATKSTWCAITGVSRKGLKSGKFAFNNEPQIELHDGICEKQDNRTGQRPENVVDTSKTSKAPDGETIRPVIIVGKILSPVGGGEGEEGEE